jgi:hypothetical protein
MKNMKIKSYSLKKTNTQNFNTHNNFFTTNYEKQLNEKDKIQTNLNDMLINEVEKIIKSPSLNISSKLDSKGTFH